MAHETHAKSLPAELGAPAFVDGWKTRALVVGAIFSVIAVILALLGQAQDHEVAGAVNRVAGLKGVVDAKLLVK